MAAAEFAGMVLGRHECILIWGGKGHAPHVEGEGLAGQPALSNNICRLILAPIPTSPLQEEAGGGAKRDEHGSRGSGNDSLARILAVKIVQIPLFGTGVFNLDGRQTRRQIAEDEFTGWGEKEEEVIVAIIPIITNMPLGVGMVNPRSGGGAFRGQLDVVCLVAPERQEPPRNLGRTVGEASDGIHPTIIPGVARIQGDNSSRLCVLWYEGKKMAPESLSVGRVPRHGEDGEGKLPRAGND